MKNVLVTGSNGFVGKHLINELVENGYQVTGVGIDDSKLKERSYKYKKIDLNNIKEILTLDLKSFDYVIHLAGLAAVGPSFDNPVLYLNTNLDIEANLFEACIRQDARPLFLIISSGSLYKPDQKLPLNESSEIEATSPYAVSKIGQEELAKYYRKRSFKCIIARPFNHIGPGQGLGFITSDFAHQVFNNLKTNKKKFLVGNLSAKRDYTDVRDIARGYRLLIEKGVDGETYNLCSGESYSGQSILKRMLSLVNVEFKIIKDPTKYRSVDYEDIYGSFNKINKATGWKPIFSLNSSIKDIMDYWRENS